MPPLTPADLQAAIDLANDKRELLDQQGRRWGRWFASCSALAATCSKCGKSLEVGYCLLPEAHIKICASHVERRWL